MLGENENITVNSGIGNDSSVTTLANVSNIQLTDEMKNYLREGRKTIMAANAVNETAGMGTLVVFNEIFRNIVEQYVQFASTHDNEQIEKMVKLHSDYPIQFEFDLTEISPTFQVYHEKLSKYLHSQNTIPIGDKDLKENGVKRFYYYPFAHDAEDKPALVDMPKLLELCKKYNIRLESYQQSMNDGIISAHFVTSIDLGVIYGYMRQIQEEEEKQSTDQGSYGTL